MKRHFAKNILERKRSEYGSELKLLEK